MALASMFDNVVIGITLSSLIEMILCRLVLPDSSVGRFSFFLLSVRNLAGELARGRECTPEIIYQYLRVILSTNWVIIIGHYDKLGVI